MPLVLSDAFSLAPAASSAAIALTTRLISSDRDGVSVAGVTFGRGSPGDAWAAGADSSAAPTATAAPAAATANRRLRRPGPDMGVTMQFPLGMRSSSVEPCSGTARSPVIVHLSDDSCVRKTAAP